MDEMVKEDLFRLGGCLSMDLMKLTPGDEHLRQKEPETHKSRTLKNV